jgi:hypothetical protein
MQPRTTSRPRPRQMGGVMVPAGRVAPKARPAGEANPEVSHVDM